MHHFRCVLPLSAITMLPSHAEPHAGWIETALKGNLLTANDFMHNDREHK
jgi:hypothetical protein